MNTKTLITGLALTGALMAGTSAVKANAFLEVISGTSYTTISVPSGDNASSTASIGGWGLNYSINGTASGGGGELDVLLNAQVRGTPTHGLTIIYSSGDPYTQDGVWTYGLSESGNNTVGSTAEVFWSHSLYTPPSPAYMLGNLGTALVGPGGETTLSLPASTGGGSTSATPAPDNLSSYYITEELNIAGGATAVNPGVTGGTGTRPSFNGGVTFTAVGVPDGGMTMALLGTVFLGLAGIRSKFARK